MSWFAATGLLYWLAYGNFASGHEWKMSAVYLVLAIIRLVESIRLWRERTILERSWEHIVHTKLKLIADTQKILGG